MNYEEKIAKLEAARAAVEAAKVACEAAGFDLPQQGAAGDVFAVTMQKIDAARASVERQRLPIAIGGWVEISDGHRAWARWELEAAKVKWLTIGGAKFDRATGEMQGATGWGRRVHPDDLARINRDLPAKRGGR